MTKIQASQRRVVWCRSYRTQEILWCEQFVSTLIGERRNQALCAAYLKNSGKLEVAQHIANHESPRTTKLYDRRQDEISLDEIERIAI